MRYAAGVDVGGTNIECGILDAQGSILLKRKMPTRPDSGAEDILQRITATLERLYAEAGVAAQDIAVIGLGIPGLVDPEVGMSLRAVNLNWIQVPVAAMLRELTGKPVFIDNDVRMYTYGEAVAGAGRGYEYIYGITIGTGLAAAYVQRGGIYRGHRFLAGEIGHIPVNPAGITCGCGRTGCLETIVSATGIARQARTRIVQGEHSLLRERFADVEDIRASDVSRASREGDGLSRDVLERTGRELGRALSWVVPILAPDVIIIGGGGALAGEDLTGPMRQEMNARLLQDYAGRTAIRYAALGDDAGVIGSGLWALSQLNK
ncbi:ROK family protein [Paenibacillus sp. MMS20-IR301]|uniref:ROK family protein n=1 Tax=Paenibacillus sp. MMS20-IR301 TaxID=2895946 RepID=UPI0028E82797|nr:ROK family protein [Paenibacillus sp. MMS20-IR301]WNS43939.1 ROK family protein [Paenibacillus sp. MMS20-IR301]